MVFVFEGGPVDPFLTDYNTDSKIYVLVRTSMSSSPLLTSLPPSTLSPLDWPHPFRIPQVLDSSPFGSPVVVLF
jgi:hypothetical protein